MTADMNKLTIALKVKNKIKETNQAYSFCLEIPEDLKSRFAYKPGQFISLFLQINGEDLTRSYSLPTTPGVDDEFMFTVKRVEGGKVSNYLVENIEVGSELKVTPPAGLFFNPEKIVGPRHYVLFAAGSGITPVFSILKYALLNPENKVSLLYSNRSEDGIIYQEKMLQLLSSHPGQLNVTHVLSKPGATWTGPRGRCNPDLIREFLIASHSAMKKEYFMCGPEGFMDVVENTLHSQSVSTESIHRESFQSPVELKEKNQQLNTEWTIIGDPLKASEIPETLEITLSGEQFTVNYDRSKNESVLETLINEGVNAPYSCMDGACMACMAKVTCGVVYQQDPGVLADENISSGECLTCQAKPLSKITKINFDL